MKSFAFRLAAGLLAAIALALLAGGAILIFEGGSFYYLAAGVLVLVLAVLLARRREEALLFFSGLLALTLVWSLWEVRLNGWALVPRLVGPVVIGCVLLALPFETSTRIRAKRWLAGSVLACLSVLVVAAMLALIPEKVSRAASPAEVADATAPTEWRHWGNSLGGTRYVDANQINTGNVDRLRLAWRYDSPVPPQASPSFEATPLAVDGRLYVCLQPGIVVALDQDTGRPLWRYTSPAFRDADFTKIFGGKCRGVSYFEAPRPLSECQKRILFATPDGFLMAVDAGTGRPCSSFGTAGAADMRLGMGLDKEASRVVIAMPSSPPAIVNGVAVVGQTVSDLESLTAPSGVIRGYDAESGELLWSWDAGRPDRTTLEAGENYTAATPNAWGVFSGDEELGLVFVPTGNSPPDYYGGQRPELSDRYSSSVLAIDVATGQLRWSFQTVHHDLWDYDVAAQPVVVDLPARSGTLPALLVPTKLGQIFVLDRRSGQPIDKVIEKPVPQGAVPGDWTSPTQPQTTGFPSLSGPQLREKDMWGLTPLDQLWCRIRFKRLRYQGPFTPITTRDTLMFPGTAGGINWGSVSIDRQHGIVVVNALRLAHVGRLVPRAEVGERDGGGSEGNVLFEQTGTPYAFAMSPFLSPLGVPCQPPPYGTISALDLNTRELIWNGSLGTAARSGPFGLPSFLPIRMGVPNIGGSVVTAGGLVFIGAAQDRRLRAFDIQNGRELWSAPLPALAAATPMSYVSPKSGRQYVVIAAGGHYAIPGPPAGALMAFALPDLQDNVE